MQLWTFFYNLFQDTFNIFQNSIDEFKKKKKKKRYIVYFWVLFPLKVDGPIFRI